MKKITQSTVTGQEGVNLLERRVHVMGFWWYPSLVPEAGIDGHIEIRDSVTGAMTNLIIQVQSRATTRPFANETASTFDYICEEKDLQYWLQGNAPVILVVSRPASDEAYWVPLKQYFAENPDRRLNRRITIDKQSSRFDASARDRLVCLAAPQNSGFYLSPRPKPEVLYSNLLAVQSFASHIYIAQTPYRDPADLWHELIKLEVRVGAEWTLHDGNLMSFHDVSEPPWNRFCDLGTFGQHDSREWAHSGNHDRTSQFVRLLNLALGERLRDWDVYFNRMHGCYYFRATPEFRPRRIDFAGLHSSGYRTVFQKYSGAKFSYCRHMGFLGHFKWLHKQWYLEITPTYVFTRSLTAWFCTCT